MPPRDTRTGGVLESMVLPALKRGGYDYQTQVRIGDRLGGGKHIIDVLPVDPAVGEFSSQSNGSRPPERRSRKCRSR
jgi:hypothetical protein